MSDLSLYLRAVLALVAVLALIGVIAFVLRRFGAERFKTVRGKRRLGIVEVASIDARRRLVLVKRDAAEHLLLIGGPNDILIEYGITPVDTDAVGAVPFADPFADRRAPSFKDSP